MTFFEQITSFARSYFREPEHFISNKNKCTVIYLCPCVFFESFRGLNEAKAVYISDLPLYNYDAPITSQVSSNRG